MGKPREENLVQNDEKRLDREELELPLLLRVQKVVVFVGFRDEEADYFDCLCQRGKKLFLQALKVLRLNQNELQDFLEDQKIFSHEKLLFDEKHQELDQLGEIGERLEVSQNVYEENVHEGVEGRSHLPSHHVYGVEVFLPLKDLGGEDFEQTLEHIQQIELQDDPLGEMEQEHQTRLSERESLHVLVIELVELA